MSFLDKLLKWNNLGIVPSNKKFVEKTWSHNHVEHASKLVKSILYLTSKNWGLFFKSPNIDVSSCTRVNHLHNDVKRKAKSLQMKINIWLLLFCLLHLNYAG